jgi:putative transposase
VSSAKAGIERYLTLYNTRRPHSSLADWTPDEAYFLPLSLSVAA